MEIDNILSIQFNKMALNNNNGNECNQIGPGRMVSTNKNGFSYPVYAQKLLLNLNHLRLESRFCDVDIIVGNVVISAHRAILSASSSYFEAMFRPDMGLNEGKQKSVTIHSINPEILKNLIDFIYTGQIDITQVFLIIIFIIYRETELY